MNLQSPDLNTVGLALKGRKASVLVLGLLVANCTISLEPYCCWKKQSLAQVASYLNYKKKHMNLCNRVANDS
jgi:hypothetical protein